MTKNAERKKMMYDERKAKGLCVVCGEPKEGKRVRCDGCARMNKLYDQKYYSKMSVEWKKKRREYYVEWRKNHPDKVKEYRKRKEKQNDTE